MAPLGQIAAQKPHSIHSSTSILWVVWWISWLCTGALPFHFNFRNKMGSMFHRADLTPRLRFKQNPEQQAHRKRDGHKSQKGKTDLFRIPAGMDHGNSQHGNHQGEQNGFEPSHTHKRWKRSVQGDSREEFHKQRTAWAVVWTVEFAVPFYRLNHRRKHADKPKQTKIDIHNTQDKKQNHKYPRPFPMRMDVQQLLTQINTPLWLHHFLWTERHSQEPCQRTVLSNILPVIHQKPLHYHIFATLCIKALLQQKLV